MDIVKFQHDIIDINSTISSIIRNDCGAISTFIGITRDSYENLKVLQLEYEIFSEMAYDEIINILKRCRLNWPDLRNIIVIHRIGLVPVGEISIIIASTSCHRIDSLESTRYIINEIKKSAPIWKKEVYEDGNALWKENKECNWNDKL